MVITWDDLRVFQAAVRAGGYSMAGRKLGLDRTTIGRRFARLEREIGQSLWELGPVDYRPTPAGLAILRAAAAMEKAMGQLGDDLALAAIMRSGPVRLAGTAGIATLLLPGLAGFLTEHSEISVELVAGGEAIAAVHKRMADIGIAIARTKPRNLAGLRVRAFEQRRFVANGGRTERRVGWNHAMMLANPYPWARLNSCDESVACEVEGMGAIYDAVHAGLGCAWLWRAMADRNPSLRMLPDAAPANAAADIWVVYRDDVVIDPAVAALRDALVVLLDSYPDGPGGGGRSGFE